MGVGFTADGTDVGPTVRMAVDVALQVMLKLETPTAGGAAVDRTTARERSGMRGASQLEALVDCWGTVQNLGGDGGRERMPEYELLFLAL